MTSQVTFYTTSQVAQRCGVDPSTVRRWVSIGLAAAAVTTQGGHHRFDRTEVDRLVGGVQDDGDNSAA